MFKNYIQDKEIWLLKLWNDMSALIDENNI
jgi:hypothetical protein